jgi:mRNA-degrading endonuclease YafQ of YafQ-DinJ toxin-antitoxin module
MFTLNFKSKFLKKEKKLTKKNPKLRKTIDKATDLLAMNPNNTALKSHKVIGIDSVPAFSSRVTSDIRIIWDFSKDQLRVIDLIDIGGHYGKNKVYK